MTTEEKAKAFDAIHAWLTMLFIRDCELTKWEIAFLDDNGLYVPPRIQEAQGHAE